MCPVLYCTVLVCNVRMCTGVDVCVRVLVVFGGAVDDQVSVTVARFLPNDWANTVISVLLLCHLLSAFVIILNPVSQHIELVLHVPPGAPRLAASAALLARSHCI